MDGAAAVVPGAEGAPGTNSADTLILVAMADTVLMPGMVMPLSIGRPAAAAAMQEAARTQQHLAVVLQRDPAVEATGLDSLHAIGTEARLLRYFTGRDGSHNAVVQGTGRVRLEGVSQASHPIVTVHAIAEPMERSPEIDARFHHLQERCQEVLRLIEQAPAELAATVQAILGEAGDEQ